MTLTCQVSHHLSISDYLSLFALLVAVEVAWHKNREQIILGRDALWMESEVQLNPSISCKYYYICWVATMFTWLYSSLCLKSPDPQRRNVSYEDLYGSVAKQTCPNGDPTGLFGHIIVVWHGMRWTALNEWLVSSSFSENDSREIGGLWWYTQFLLWSMAASDPTIQHTGS